MNWKLITSLCVGLVVVAGSVFAADAAVKVDRIAQLKNIYKTDKPAALTFANAILADDSATLAERKKAIHFGFNAIIKNRNAFFEALSDADKKIAPYWIRHAYFMGIGDFAEAKQIATLTKAYNLLAASCAGLGDKVGEYAAWEKWILTGKLTPTQFIVALAKLRLVSLSVTNAVYLQTLNDASRFCHPVEQDFDLWADAASKLDLCKRDLAAIIAAE